MEGNNDSIRPPLEKTIKLPPKPRHYTIRLDAPVSVISDKNRKTETLAEASANVCNDQNNGNVSNDESRRNNNDDNNNINNNHKTSSSTNSNDKKLSFFNTDEDEDECTLSDCGTTNKQLKSSPTNFITKFNSNPIEKKNEQINIIKFRSEKKVELENVRYSSSESYDDDRMSERLDYDEDSVKSSPISPKNKNESMISDEAKIYNISKFHTIEENKNLTKDKSLNNQQDDQQTNNPIELNNSSNKLQSRIKSFINLNHEIEVSNIRSVENGDHSTTNGKGREGKSYNDLLKYFFKNACFFQIKSINHENVKLSKDLGVWSTSVPNEMRLNAAFKENRNVILIFSVQQSGAFQGFARMTTESRPANRPVPWVLPERLSNISLGGIFQVDWLCTKELSFNETQELLNPFNGNKPVKIARDGQQLESKVGKKLCKLFPRDSKTRLLTFVETLRYQISQRKKAPLRYDRLDNIYPFPERSDMRKKPNLDSNHHKKSIQDGFGHYFGRPNPVRLPINYPHNGQRSNIRGRINDMSYSYQVTPRFFTPHGSMRSSYHAQRGPAGLTPRYTMPYTHGEYLRQGQAHPIIEPNNYDVPVIHEDNNRYHPYQRIRR